MSSGTMERILRLMAEKKASDVYLSAHAPAMIKINGQTIPINSQVLPPEAPKNLLSEVVPPNRIEELVETGELNMAVPLDGVGNFRVSAMRQRGSYAIVVRFVPADVPPLDSLNVPPVLADLVMEKRFGADICHNHLAVFGNLKCIERFDWRFGLAFGVSET